MGKATTPVTLKTLEKAKQDKHDKTAKTADNQRQRENFEHIQEKKPITYRRSKIGITAEFLSEIMQARR